VSGSASPIISDARRRRRFATAAFLALLALSITWPSPVVSTNLLWIGADLDVDHLSFLGREAPSWDVVFWCVAGLLLLVILQSAVDFDFRAPIRILRSVRFRAIAWRRVAIALAIGAAVTAAVWRLADVPLLAWAEGVQGGQVENLTRLVNRLGGGMNPVMIVAFFLVAGVAYRERRWVSYSVAMAISGIVAGGLAQIVKLLVGRGRPELWLGPTLYTPGSSTSFPSGHTVGAFALAGVLVFGARSLPLRVFAFLVASAVGMSRILGFRHWGSDVTASAILGLITAWAVWRVVEDGAAAAGDREPPAASDSPA
jgi:undecaprenyl-diphosphatase